MRNPYLDLAKKAVHIYLKEKKVITPPDLPPEMLSKKAAVFVSIYKKENGKKELRGCIGTFLPTCKNIAEEIIKNAISAATQNWRFPPILKEELDNLVFSVDILSSPVLLKNSRELNPKKYGIIIKSDQGKIGLLLPDIEGIFNPRQQILVACQKAGIDPEKDNFLIYKFKTQRYKENECMQK